MIYDSNRERELIMEAVGEYFYGLIQNGNFKAFTPNYDEESAMEDAYEEADYIIERLEALLHERWV